MISVLVPIYNKERYLRRTIESLITQSYTYIEIVLVDDGSVDSSLAICMEYAALDERIRVIHQENGGLASARVAGLSLARGEYVAFVDADDYVESIMYEQLMEPLIRDDSIDIVAGGHVIEEFDGTIKCPLTNSEARNYDDSLLAMTDMFTGERFIWTLCDKVYRRSLFTSELLASWPAAHGEDTYINSRLFLRARRIRFAPVYGYHYCMNSDSMMHAEFTPAKLITADITYELAQRYAKYPALYQALARLYAGYMVDYLRDMQRANGYDSYIAKCRSQVAHLLPDVLTDTQRYLLSILTRPVAEYKKWKEDWQMRIADFVRDSETYIYIYGTGYYAGAVAEFLGSRGMYFRGFVETVPHRVSYLGRPVLAAEALSPNDYVIYGLGFDNTAVVSATTGARFRYTLPIIEYLSCI